MKIRSDSCQIPQTLLLLSLDAHNHVDDYSGALHSARLIKIPFESELSAEFHPNKLLQKQLSPPSNPSLDFPTCFRSRSSYLGIVDAGAQFCHLSLSLNIYIEREYNKVQACFIFQIFALEGFVKACQVGLTDSYE